MRSLFLLINLILLSCNIFSQDSSFYKLDEIVVTATKTNTSFFQLASSVTVINKDELLKKNKPTLTETLKSVEGIDVISFGSPGGLSSVFMRGADPGQTLLLIDGIVINYTTDPGNTVDLSSINVENIERIEIVRGPQSILYGSSALAGVINIITNKISSSPKYNINFEGGTYKTYRGGISTAGTTNNLFYNLSLSRFQSEGFSSAKGISGNEENDSYYNNNISGSIGYIFSEKNSLILTGRFTKLRLNYDQSGGSFGDDPNLINRVEEKSFKLEGSFTLLNDKWKIIPSVSFIRNVRNDEDDFDFINTHSFVRSLYDGSRVKADLQNNIEILSGQILVTGISWEEEKALTDYYSESAWGPFESVFPQVSSNILSYYIQQQFSINNRFFGAVGGRVDRHSNFGTVFTYRIAPSYFIKESNTKIKATFGSGFKAPSLYYLNDSFVGNPDLLPEKSFGWDAGFEQFFPKFNTILSVTYFNNKFTDLFGFDENFKTINIKNAVTKGVELNVLISPVNNFNIKISHSLVDSKNKTENDPDENKNLIRRPSRKSSADFSYLWNDKLSTNLEIIYTGIREDFNFDTFPFERIYLGDYTLINFSANYKLTDLISLTGRIHNLFDKNYEDIFGYNVAGRSIYGGFRLNL